MDEQRAVRRRHRAGRLLVGLTTAVATLGLAGLPALGAAGDTGGRRPGAALSHVRASLSDVALVPNSSQAWAVGYQETASLDDKPLAYRWNGSGWVMTAVPNAGLGAYLEDVVALSRSNAWAVGAYYASTHDHRPFVVHWNGSTWRRVSAPALHGGLRGVSAGGGSRPWAVGYAVTDVGGDNVDSTLALRWNGSAWKRVSTPGLGYTLEDVDAVSGSNVWAVGDNENRALALRWNGSAWKRASTPAVSYPTVEGVAALPTQAWAVGSRASSWSGPKRTLLLHWRAGGGWSRATVPSPGFAAQLHGVAATSATNVWAVGQYQASSGDERPLVLRWNGSTWRAIEPPGPTGHVALDGVAARSTTLVWAVGRNFFNFDPAFYAYLVRWNGSTWTWWWS